MAELSEIVVALARDAPSVTVSLRRALKAFRKIKDDASKVSTAFHLFSESTHPGYSHPAKRARTLAPHNLTRSVEEARRHPKF